MILLAILARRDELVTYDDRGEGGCEFLPVSKSWILHVYPGVQRANVGLAWRYYRLAPRGPMHFVLRFLAWAIVTEQP